MRFFWGAVTDQRLPVARFRAIYICRLERAPRAATAHVHPSTWRAARLPLPVLRADADVLRARYVLVQMYGGVGATGDKRGLHPGRAGGLAAIAAVMALRLLVGVGRSRSCLLRRGRAGGCSSPLALRARCLSTPSPARD
eukprot:COSAG01_NODE_1908_length_8929_cov_219.706195_7_plen_140_part_00